MITFEDILTKKKELNPETKYRRFGLNSNPFPKSGTANINEPTETTYLLPPINRETTIQVARYVADSLYSDDNTEDHKLIGTITGDYGTGKTQLLLFARALILKQDKKSYVVYINNPGTKISELVGSILDKIGKEQFKKYLWNQIIREIQNSGKYKDQLTKYITPNLFSEDPFDPKSMANHKSFLNGLTSQTAKDNIKRRELNNTLKEIILDILARKNDDIIAHYFYDLISEDIGVNKAWSTLVSGVGLHTGKNPVKLLNAIISIIKEQGYKRFYFLVDEFEDITSGRLTKRNADNYIYNLRTLIDQERRWCLLIAMTSEALRDLRKVSPPLYDRLTNIKIEINSLSDDEARLLLINHLNLVRKTNDSLFPFTEGLVRYLNRESKNIPRFFLRSLYFLLEKATERSECELISEEFINED